VSHLSRALMTACADGELLPGEAERVEKHLQGCSRCQHELVMLGNVRSRLRLLDPPTPSGDLTHKLMLLAGLPGQVEEPSHRWGSSTPLGAGPARLRTSAGPVDADENQSL
jgi:anti-sigma factor RsiW